MVFCTNGAIVYFISPLYVTIRTQHDKIALLAAVAGCYQHTLEAGAWSCSTGRGVQNVHCDKKDLVLVL